MEEEKRESVADSLDKIDRITKEAETDTVIRASGGCICSYCGKRYDEHQLDNRYLYEGKPFLHRLCNSDLVKL